MLVGERQTELFPPSNQNTCSPANTQYGRPKDDRISGTDSHVCLLGALGVCRQLLCQNGSSSGFFRFLGKELQQRGGGLGSLERRTVHRKNRKGEYALQDFPCVLFQRPSESVHVV
ncbi:hypothetical protein NL676_031419 [Syzygium grande]|nr:hypothetical protein NL676_031419 [Syzygium grande]